MFTLSINIHMAVLRRNTRIIWFCLREDNSSPYIQSQSLSPKADYRAIIQQLWMAVRREKLVLEWDPLRPYIYAPTEHQSRETII